MAKKVNPLSPCPETSVRNREPVPCVPGFLQEAMAALFLILFFIAPPPKVP